MLAKADAMQANVTPFISKTKIIGNATTEAIMAITLPQNAPLNTRIEMSKSFINHMKPVRTARIIKGYSKYT